MANYKHQISVNNNDCMLQINLFCHCLKYRSLKNNKKHSKYSCLKNNKKHKKLCLFVRHNSLQTIITFEWKVRFSSNKKEMKAKSCGNLKIEKTTK